MDFSSDGLVVGGHFLHLGGEPSLAQDRRLVRISTFPDDVLLDIFDFCVIIDDSIWGPRRNLWHALVHVCRRWRYLVFASPRRLNLRLAYYGHRPMSEALEDWPIMPITLASRDPRSDHWQWWDNTVAALESEHYNRICEIYMRMADSRWERFAAAMQKPFPELTYLEVWTTDLVPVLPDSFLGGSAPRLRTLRLSGIPFPSLPKLLLSAHGLVRLDLMVIPDSGYISPDEMATALTVMTSLKSLDLGFRSPQSRPDPESRPLPLPTRFVLTALTQFEFTGVYEYLEDLLARIDTPNLFDFDINFFMDLDFDVPQLHRLIDHVEEFKTSDHVYVWIDDLYIKLVLYSDTSEVNDRRGLKLVISCRELDYQLSSLAQLCRSSFSFISTLEELRIIEGYDISPSHWKDDMETAQWIELLDAFTTVKNLYITERITQYYCGAFQELSVARSIEVLPALCNLLVPGSSLQSVQEAMMPFIAARQLSDHPVVVDRWEAEAG